MTVGLRNVVKISPSNSLFCNHMRTLLLFMAVLCPAVLSAQGNTPDRWDVRFGPPGLRHERNFPEAIKSFTTDGQRLYIGGMFADVNGVAANGLAFWDGQTLKPLAGGGIRDEFGWSSSNVVNTMVRTGDHLIIGGYFGMAGSATASNLARYHIPSGSWSAYAGGVEHEVLAMRMVGDTLWVGLGGGGFVSRIHMPSQTWRPFDTPPVSGPVHAIASTPEGLFIGGAFQAQSNIRTYKDGVWSDIGGVANIGSGGNQAVVSALTTHNGYLIVGGAFNTVTPLEGQAVPVSHIARYHLSTRTWSAIPSGGMNAAVQSLSTFGDDLIAGGYFRFAGELEVARIARWSNSEGWRAMDGGINRQNPDVSGGFGVLALATHAGELVVGGSFAQVRQVPEQTQVFNLVRWTGAEWKAFGEGVSGNQIRSIALLRGQPDRVLVVGDNLNDAGSSRIRGVGVWDGGGWGTLRDGFSGQVGLRSPAGFPDTPGNGYQVITRGDIAYLGGDFGFMEFDQRIQQFNSFGTFENLQVAKTLAPDHEGLLYVGGTRFVNGVPTPFIQKWTGRIWRDLGPIEGSDVVAMVDMGGRLIAAGPFTSLKGTSASYLAQYDPATQSWSAFGQPNHEVHALHLTSSSLYVGGQFTQIGGIAANNIARYDLAGGTWHALGDGISETWGPGGRVLAITTLGDLVYAGGLFSKAGSVPADYIARWDGQQWDELGGGTDDAVTALAAHPNGWIYIGGYFNRVGDGIPSAKFAIWDQTDRPVSIPDHDESEIATGIRLLPAYPNPFNPTTAIGFTLDTGRQTRLTVVDMIGREVTVLVNGMLPAGTHRVEFNASRLASGVYQVVLTSNGQRITQGITVLK